MLLLVLILVMIAFGLLLVGFLSSSVLWAWVSVAVSVGAAGVLLYDFLQRRAVVRAGDEAGVDVPSGSAPERAAAEPERPLPAAGSGGRGDVEPVTELIPVIRPVGATGPQPPAVDPRFDPDADAQQTVIMPAVQPSGSPVGPSGATPSQTASREYSSPTVTVTKAATPVPDPSAGADQSTLFVRVDGAEASPPTPVDPGSAPTTATPVGAGPSGTTGTGGPAGPPADGADPDRAPADRGDPAASDVAATTAFAGRPPGVPGTQPAGEQPTGSTAPEDGEPSGAAPPDDPPEPGSGAPTGSGDVEATAAVAAPLRDERPVRTPPAESPGSLFASGPTGNGAPSGGSAGSGPDSPPAAPAVEPPPAREPAVAESAAASTVRDAVPEVPAVDDEAPEEQSDPAAAAVVAGLEDDVLVIDEQPRYHVPGCRALAAASLIPLPAREAVELGFTPCGWCSPDRTLAGRHSANAR